MNQLYNSLFRERLKGEEEKEESFMEVIWRLRKYCPGFKIKALNILFCPKKKKTSHPITTKDSKTYNCSSPPNKLITETQNYLSLRNRLTTIITYK